MKPNSFNFTKNNRKANINKEQQVKDQQNNYKSWNQIDTTNKNTMGNASDQKHQACGGNKARNFKFARKQEFKEQKAKKKQTPVKADLPTDAKASLPRELMPIVELQKWKLRSTFQSYVFAHHFISSFERNLNCQQKTSYNFKKIQESLHMYDGEHYVQKLNEEKANKSHETIIFKPTELISTALNQWPGHFISQVVEQILRVALQLEKLANEPCYYHLYLVLIKFKGNNIYNEEISFQTGSIELKSLLSLYLSSIIAQETTDKDESLRKVWKMFGFDTHNTSGGLIPNNLVNIRLESFQFMRGNGLPLNVPQTDSLFSQPYALTNSTIQVNTESKMPLYAISRARIQYLGQNIPMFIFQHTLFEALISALHPEDVSPEGVDNSTDLTKHDLLKQEKSLYLRYLEFIEHPNLKPLFELSLKGNSEEFVRTFNNLTEDQHSEYFKTKISLYDINQRKFVIDNTAHPRKAFIVHYNGFVFGTNMAKMFTIREREIGLHQLDVEDSSDEFEETEDILIVRKDRQQPLKQVTEEKQNAQELPDDENIAEISESLSEEEKDSSMSDVSSDNEDVRMRAGDDIVSEVDLRQAFVMTSNVTKSGSRRKKILSQLPKNKSNVTLSSGLLALRVEYETTYCETFSTKRVRRVLCYGYFPWLTQQTQHVFKTFEGIKSPELFIVWLLQNVINYYKDARQQSRFVNIFTVNGSSKALPEILRALIQIVGRDAHFIGDANKVKLIWYENIRFFDINNYFDGFDLRYFVKKWINTKDQIEKLKATSKDDIGVFKTLLLYEVVYRFLDELHSMAFNNGKNTYDFSLHGQATASSLALSIFQYLYLDKQHIKGTSDLEIFEKEKQSLKSAYYTINRLKSTDFEVQMDGEEPIYRLYEIKHSMAACFRDFPIPFEYTKRREYHVSFKFEEGKYSFSYRTQQYLDIYHTETRQSFRLMYTSLYKVDKLEKLKHCFILPEETPFGLDISNDKLNEKFIWGCELIHAILEMGSRHSIIAYLEISEEISYLQGKIFTNFVSEIWEKYRHSHSQCQKDILEMILDSFPSKFNMKYFGVQQIIHINDLLLMKQTAFQNLKMPDGSEKPCIQRLYEIKYPYYYIEYYPKGSDSLQQICSLVRITSYINACHRVKQFQNLLQFEGPRALSNIQYLDHQYLLLKNRELIDHQIAQIKLPVNPKQINLDLMAKYRVILEAQSDDPQLASYVKFFEQKGTLNQIMHNQATSSERVPQTTDGLASTLVKTFNTYKLLAKPNLDDPPDAALLDNYLGLLLSSPQSSPYQSAPLILDQQQQLSLAQKKSQIASISQTHKGQHGISREQAVLIKNLIEKKVPQNEELSRKEVEEEEKKVEGLKKNEYQGFQEIIEGKYKEEVIALLKEQMAKFKGDLEKREAEGHNYYTQNLKSFSQLSQHHQKQDLQLADNDESSNLMSQTELQMALQCQEDSSSQTALNINTLPKTQNGNLVSEFFSQTNTR